jgi:peroxiredoxin
MVHTTYIRYMKCICITFAVVLLAIINVSAQVPAQTIPSFTFKRLDKKEFANKDLQPGKILFFVFFDTQCDHCQRSIQYIGEHYTEFKKTAIYLITLDSLEKITPFMSKFGSKLKDKKNVTILQDTKSQFIQKFKPMKYPSLFLYSSKKELILYEDDEQSLSKFIEQVNAAAK